MFITALVRYVLSHPWPGSTTLGLNSDWTTRNSANIFDIEYLLELFSFLLGTLTDILNMNITWVMYVADE